MAEGAPGRFAVSVFSGSGGLDLGIARAGFETRVAVEIDPVAAASLEANKKAAHLVAGWPYLGQCKVLNEDVRDVTTEQVLAAARLAPGQADLMVGGPPCVTFSFAGRREGLKNATGRLYTEYARVLSGVRPKAFIFENVRGILAAPDEDGVAGGAFPKILAALKGAGYAVTYGLVDAADYGVPQHRHRVIVVGRLGDQPLTLPGATHGHPMSLLVQAGQLEPWETVRDAIDELPAAATDSGTAEDAYHLARAHSKEVVASFAATPVGSRNPLYRRYRLGWDAPARAIIAQGKAKVSGSGLNGSHQAIHPEENRLLTIRETARLQTFPDWYSFHRAAVHSSRLIGDAVPPLLGEVVASHIAAQLEADATASETLVA